MSTASIIEEDPLSFKQSFLLSIEGVYNVMKEYKQGLAIPPEFIHVRNESNAN